MNIFMSFMANGVTPGILRDVGESCESLVKTLEDNMVFINASWPLRKSIDFFMKNFLDKGRLIEQLKDLKVINET